MKIDVDGERSRQRLPLARKLLRKCRLADLEQKAVNIDGFLISVKPGEDELQDQVRVVAPVGAVATASLPDKVRWIAAEHVWGSAVGLDFTICYEDDPDCANREPPNRSVRADAGTRLTYLQVEHFIDEVVVSRWAFNSLESGGYSIRGPRTHVYGSAQPQTRRTPVVGDPAAVPISITNASEGVPAARVYVTLGSVDVAEETQFVVDVTLATSPVEVHEAPPLMTDDIKSLVGLHADADPTTITMSHAAVAHTIAGYGASSVTATIWVAARYRLLSGSTSDYADALSARVQYDPFSMSWDIIPGSVTHSASGVEQGAPGELVVPMGVLYGGPYNHTFNRVTFYDADADAVLVWGAWDGYNGDMTVGHYNWAHAIPADPADGSIRLETYFKNNGAGPYTFPPGMTDPWVRPEYVQGMYRWFMLYRQFEDGTSQRNTVHSIHIGTPADGWTTIPLPHAETYHVQPTWMDAASDHVTLELLAVAKDPEGQLRFWVYQDFWGALEPAGWRKAAPIDDPEIEADPAAAMWSVSLYGKQIDSRYGDGGGGVSPMPMIPVPA